MRACTFWRMYVALYSWPLLGLQRTVPSQLHGVAFAVAMERWGASKACMAKVIRCAAVALHPYAVFLERASLFLCICM